MPEKPVSLKALLESRRKHFGRMHQEWEREEKLVQQEFAGLFQAQYDITIHESSVASDIVNQFRNQIRTDEPTVTFKPVGTSREALSHATLMTNWGYGMLKKERENGGDPTGQCAYNGLHPGVVAKRILVDARRIPDKPPTEDKKSKEYRRWEEAVAASWPFISEAVDPRALYPTPGGRRPLYDMLEVQQRTLSDMWRDYPQWADPRGGTLEKAARTSPDRPVEVLIYWSADIRDENGKVTQQGYYIVEADGERVIDVENPYGFVNYIYEWSGLGVAKADGDPMHLGIGILRGKRGEIEELVRLYTAFSTMALMYVFPTMLTTEDEKVLARKFSVGPARIVRHAPGQPPTFLEHPPPNETLLRFIEKVEGRVSVLMVPALMGGRDPGVQYGVQQAQQIAQALKAIAPLRATLDRMGSLTLNMMARMMRVMGITITVEGSGEKAERGRMVRGEDFEHYNFEVHFEAVDPVENDRRLLTGLAMLRAGAIPLRIFWSVYARHIITDPDEAEAMMNVEKIMAYLNETGTLAQIVLQEEGQAELISQQVAAQEGAKRTIQKRAEETVPQVTGAVARELEQLGGTPGALNVPMELAEEGAREAAPR